MNLARVGVWTKDLDRLAPRHNHLLRLRAGKVSMNGLRDARGLLQSQ